LVGSRQDESDQVLVEVKDAGVGIAPENMSQLFNAFFAAKHGDGTIDLPFRHRDTWGRIWASGKAGPGATFHITLPPVRRSS
jgi:signal transduction histidine kinase